MKDIRLISSKIITAELYQDFNIDNDDWVNKVNRHIERAMGLMRIDGFYVRKTLIQDVKEFKAPLPCDAKYIMAVLHNMTCLTRLPLTRGLALGENFKDVVYNQTLKGGIENNYLHTNFEEGKIMYVYYGIPKNDCDELMIPDCPEVLEALPFFILYKLSLSGYKHPIIDYVEAQRQWNRLYPIARNKMNYWSIEEAHQFTKMNNNPLFIDIIDEEWSTEYDTYNTRNLHINSEANQTKQNIKLPSDYVGLNTLESILNKLDEKTEESLDFKLADSDESLFIDDGQGGVAYYLYLTPTNEWMIRYININSVGDTVVSMATSANNPTYISYVDAWNNKTILNYA